MAHVDWLFMASLRETSNWFLKIDASRDAMSEAYRTTAEEIRQWIDRVLGYSDSQWTTTRINGEMDALRAAGEVVKDGGVAFLHISGELLEGRPATWFPNHFVTLVGVPAIANGRARFQVQSWGRIYTVDLPESTVAKYFWGTITGRLNLAGDWVMPLADGSSCAVQFAHPDPRYKSLWTGAIYYPNTSRVLCLLKGVIVRGKCTYNWFLYSETGHPTGSGDGEFTTVSSNILSGWWRVPSGAAGYWTFLRKR
jgi:hypothetical protein